MRSRSNSEYLAVLRRVVERVQSEYRVEGLGNLTPEQLHRWFTSITLHDLEQVVEPVKHPRAA